jgi:hypothetical protein
VTPPDAWRRLRDMRHVLADQPLIAHAVRCLPLCDILELQLELLRQPEWPDLEHPERCLPTSSVSGPAGDSDSALQRSWSRWQSTGDRSGRQRRNVPAAGATFRDRSIRYVPRRRVPPARVACWDGVVLPQGWYGVLLWTQLREQLLHRRGLLRPELARDPQMMLGPLLSSVMTPAGPASDVCLFARPWA